MAAYLPGLVPTAPGHLGDVLLTLVVRRVGGPRPLGLCHQVPGEVSKLGVLRLRRAYQPLERFVGIDALSRHDDANCLADHRTVNECSAQASYLSVCCCELRHSRLSICGSLVALCRVPQALVRAAYQFLLPSRLRYLIEGMADGVFGVPKNGTVGEGLLVLAPLDVRGAASESAAVGSPLTLHRAKRYVRSLPRPE